jgi:hypothetical protein
VWSAVVATLVAGYLLLGRSFAYIGVPSLGVFIGEASLALFAAARPRAMFGRWIGSIINSTSLAPVAWTMLALVSCGALDAARGLAAGYAPQRVLQTFAFCVYPTFLLVGVHVGLEKPRLLERLLQVLAWAGGLWGAAYVIWISDLDWSLPYAPEVRLLGFGGAASVALVGIFASPRRLRRSMIPIALNSFALLGMLVRARWVGVLAGLAVIGAVRGKVRRVVGIALAGGLLLVLASALDIELPAPTHRGGSLSSREIAARMIAIVDRNEAAALGTASAGSSVTISWRFDIWAAVWKDIHRSVSTALFGWGLGRPLDEVAPFVTEDLRSPHNFLVFALAYMGWTGLAIFVAFQLALLGLLWSAFRASGNPFGIANWVLTLVVALLGNVLETPAGAVPFYLLSGLAAAPMLRRVGDTDAGAARA